MFNIGSQTISQASPVYIIAEAGVNHNGSVELAERLIEAACSSGANAIKFQTYKSEKLASSAAKKAAYQMASGNGNQSQLEMLKSLELSYEEFAYLQKVCEKKGVEFLSTPFDLESADFLHTLGVAAFKIGSGDITNLPLIKKVSAFQLPIILSTGMSGLKEIEEALNWIQHEDVSLLHCTSSYPAPSAELNLRAIVTLNTAFQKITGYSDHTLGFEAAVASVVLGAKLIEKHITLDHSLPGPDHQASLNPKQFTQFIRSIRKTEESLGTGIKSCSSSELDTKEAARKSLIVTSALSAGDFLSKNHLAIKRPGNGVPPKYYSSILGKRIKKEKKADEPLYWDDLL